MNSNQYRFEKRRKEIKKKKKKEEKMARRAESKKQGGDDTETGEVVEGTDIPEADDIVEEAAAEPDTAEPAAPAPPHRQDKAG